MITRRRKQAQRLVEFGVDQTVDSHCHILPGVDDGPKSLADALALAEMLVDDGTTDVIATPHQLGRWDGVNLAPAIRTAVGQLQLELTRNNIPLTVHPGGEVRLDERIPALLGRDQILTLADRQAHLLLELPSALAIDPKLLAPLGHAAGLQLVLAHVERYDLALRNPDTLKIWTDAGIALQVNAGTLMGGKSDAEAAAWHWLEAGYISLIASDAHSTGTRRPQMTAALTRITQRLGRETAKRVCIDGPLALLRGERIPNPAR